MGGPEWEDAQARHAAHPDTFHVPDAAALAAIEPGFTAKICDGKERFWVHVTAVDGEALTGRVGNQLVQQDVSYHYGAVVCFARRHIFDLHSPADRQRLLRVLWAQ